MKATGIVRRIDDLGRVVIPTEIPVSYTHLDVYKRQWLCRAVRECFDTAGGETPRWEKLL